LRLSLVRKYFGLENKVEKSYLDKKGFLHLNIKKIQVKPIVFQLEKIKDLYVYWRDFDEFMPVKFNYKDQKIVDVNELNTTTELYCNYLQNNSIKATSYLDFVFYESLRSEWHFIKSCKRGNDIYINEIEKKFKPLIEAEPKIFFDTTINLNRKINRFTPMLYLTATMDPKTTTIEKAWLNFGNYWNTFITNIRKQFGKLFYLRAWQSQENGYPHWHALIYFDDILFSSVYNWDNNKKLTWRISSRQKLHKGDKLTIRQRFKKAWIHGNLDIQCISNTQDCFKDLLKYVTRELEGGESDLTNAMVWYFGKQSFAYSKDFFNKITGKKMCIDLAEPNNADLINAISTNSNFDLVSIEVFPVLPASFFKSFYQSTIKDWVDPPDPPPELIQRLELLQEECSVKYSVRKDGVKIICYSLKNRGF
jgi:hypothetical protein